jgi:hypothetical protein
METMSAPDVSFYQFLMILIMNLMLHGSFAGNIIRNHDESNFSALLLIIHTDKA